MLVRVAGIMFDNLVLPNNAVRPICTRWVGWSSKRLLELARVVTGLRVVAVHARRSSRGSSGAVLVPPTHVVAS